MRRARQSTAFVLCVSAWSVLHPSITPVVLGAQTAAPRTPTTNGTARDVDGGWPRDYTTPGGASLRVFQPQVASWDGKQRMVAYAAVSYATTGAVKPALGTVKFEADTAVAVDERLVNFSSIKLTQSNFPGLSKDQLQDIVAAIEQVLPKAGSPIALDRVLARLDKSQIVPKNVVGVKSDPPVIFYSTAPAILVNLDNDPVWSPIKGNDLRFAVNTNWDLFEHGPTRTFYLRNGGSWLSATDVKGPWTAAGKLPASFSQLPADDNQLTAGGS